MMFAEITEWGLLYILGSIIGMVLLCIFCFIILTLFLIDLPQCLFGPFNIKVKETLMFICFFLGFMIGMLGGGEIVLQLAIWLGFRRGDLPSLFKLN